MITLPISQNNKLIYNIVLDDGNLFEHLDLSAFKDRKALIITDQNVKPLYADTLKAAIQDVFCGIYEHAIPPGEASKNLEQIRQIYDALCDAHFDRHDLIIALGGGVIGDMAGFAAATYMRGIRFVQIPTTLLSQTDSSIGGKTGVDYNGYKNIIGAFNMPSLVYIHPVLLRTLSGRQFSCGMGEVIKHSLIHSNDYATFLRDQKDNILKGDIKALITMISESCKIKGGVVERDPKERGERMLLNFGHTIGHALEKEMNFKLLHGECVALGAVAASYISYCRNMISLQDLKDIEQLFSLYNLPVRLTAKDLKECFTKDNFVQFDLNISEKLNPHYLPDVIIKHIKSDKKKDNNRIRFVLLKHAGEAIVDDSVTDQELHDAVAYILDCNRTN